MIRWLKKRSTPPPPPWMEPRRVSEQSNREDYATLKLRLDAAWRDRRDTIYKDRETGLYWAGVAMDYGPVGAADEQLRPLGLAPPKNIPVRESFDKDYVERYISQFGSWAIDGWHFKVYSISPRGRGISEDEHYVAARNVVENLIPDASNTPHFGNGFVIIHYGTEAVWLQVNWWIEDGMCAGKSFKAPLNQSPLFELVDGPIVAGVWELVVIDFERQTWVDVILKRTGSLSVYQQTWIPPTYY